jgi:hypothetical protein
MIFSFVFFFERSMQIPIKIPTESIQDKEIEYFTLLIYMVHDYSFFGSTADFVMKKGTFWIFTEFGHLALKQSGKNVIFKKD